MMQETSRRDSHRGQPTPGGRRLRTRLVPLVGVAMLVAGVCSLVPAAATSVGAATAKFSISTSPGIVPAFSAKTTDYAVRCTKKPTTHLTTTGTGPVTVGGKQYQSPVSLSLPLVANQSVEVTAGGASYFIRCLPSDFPTYHASVTGRPMASGYFVTLANYTVAFNTSGVPVWWNTGVGSPSQFEPNYSEFLSPTTIAESTSAGSFQLMGLNGVVTDTFGGGSTVLDTHDFQLMPNGDYLGIEPVTRDANLSSWGMSSTASIIDNDIVEFNPAGHVIWRWSVANHINVANANVNWHAQYPDVIHMNSIQYDGHGGIVFSARALDAVYRIDMATGAVTWKLGGSQTPQSLKFVSSKYPTNFSGQHDARLLPDGSLTVHDDGTQSNPTRAVRALHIGLNLKTHVATIWKQVTDPRTTFSLCCGSATLLPQGGWVASWGYNDFVTELSPSGAPRLTITFPGLYSYRAEAVDASVPAMRAGMNAMVAPLHQ